MQSKIIYILFFCIIFGLTGLSCERRPEIKEIVPQPETIETTEPETEVPVQVTDKVLVEKLGYKQGVLLYLNETEAFSTKYPIIEVIALAPGQDFFNQYLDQRVKLKGHYDSNDLFVIDEIELSPELEIEQGAYLKNFEGRLTSVDEEKGYITIERTEDVYDRTIRKIIHVLDDPSIPKSFEDVRVSGYYTEDGKVKADRFEVTISGRLFEHEGELFLLHQNGWAVLLTGSFAESLLDRKITDFNRSVFAMGIYKDNKVDPQTITEMVLSDIKVSTQQYEVFYKKYENEKYGFSLKFPSEWPVKEKETTQGLEVVFGEGDDQITLRVEKEIIPPELPQDQIRDVLLPSGIMAKRYHRQGVIIAPEESEYMFYFSRTFTNSIWMTLEIK